MAALSSSQEHDDHSHTAAHRRRWHPLAGWQLQLRLAPIILHQCSYCHRRYDFVMTAAVVILVVVTSMTALTTPMAMMYSARTSSGSHQLRASDGLQSSVASNIKSLRGLPHGTILLAAAEQCGRQAGNAVCPGGLCCSKWGWCGSGSDYCNSNCQSNCYGGQQKSPPPSPPPPTQSDPTPTGGGGPQCGRQAGNAVCPGGLCCRKWGYCGSGLDYCSGNDCQSNCWGQQKSPPPEQNYSPAPPPPAALRENASSSSSGGINVFAIVGIVVGVVALILIIAAALFFFSRKKPHEKKAAGKTPPLASLDSCELGMQPRTRSFTLDAVKEATNNFSNELGRGGFGSVYLGESTEGEMWAVKRAHAQTKDFEKEVKYVSDLNHRHLVRLLGYCKEDNEQILIYEYMSGGTLEEALHGNKGKQKPPARLTFKQRLDVSIGVADALSYMHSSTEDSFLHRDIKPANILLDENKQAKVADFGLLKEFSSSATFQPATTRCVGTSGYCCHVYFNTGRATTKVDVYSFGVVLLELLTGKPPIEEDRSSDRYNLHIKDWARPNIDEGRIEEIVDPIILEGDDVTSAAILLRFGQIALQCAKMPPDSRPEMHVVLSHLRTMRDELNPVHPPGSVDFSGSQHQTWSQELALV